MGIVIGVQIDRDSEKALINFLLKLATHMDWGFTDLPVSETSNFAAKRAPGSPG